MEKTIIKSALDQFGLGGNPLINASHAKTHILYESCMDHIFSNLHTHLSFGLNETHLALRIRVDGCH